MYLIAKEHTVVNTHYGPKVKLDLSKIWQVVRTAACKSGEYALYLKDDSDQFSIFKGYISYDDICNWFDMIKWK